MKQAGNRPATKEEVADFFSSMEKLFGHPIEPFKEGEAEAWGNEVWEEFYDEYARGTVTNFWILMSDLEKQAAQLYEEDSAELNELKAQTELVRNKLIELRDSYHKPEVKPAMKPLSEVWVKHRGLNYGEDGQIGEPARPIDREVIRDFWQTLESNLR